MKLTAICGK